ncbi:MAG: hypothetical protein RL657_1623 [Pseudomonadota bacterium]
MRESAHISPMPDGMGPEDWEYIGQGLQQRMALMEALVLDVHGSQSLLKQGLIPAALAVGHSGHVPLLRGIQPKAGRWLAMATFQIGRSASGWQVLSTRTCLPWHDRAREVLARAMAPWAQSWMDHTESATNRDLWVLLDPLITECSAQASAPDAPHWPGHLPRVSPRNLQVQDWRLQLSTAEGPKQVHGLIHPGADGPIDPLEQNANLHEGLAGLIQAFRQQSLSMLNAPGLGFLHTPAWSGFMGPLCRHVLQQDLILPSIPTWWCGESGVLPNAMDLWTQGWLLPTYPDDGLRPPQAALHGARLSPGQRQAWRTTLEQHGEHHTIQAEWPAGPVHEMVVLMGPQGQCQLLCTGTQPPSEWS